MTLVFWMVTKAEMGITKSVTKLIVRLQKNSLHDPIYIGIF